MIITWCHDLMDHSQIMLSITQGVTCVTCDLASLYFRGGKVPSRHEKK